MRSRAYFLGITSAEVDSLRWQHQVKISLEEKTKQNNFSGKTSQSLEVLVNNSSYFEFKFKTSNSIRRLFILQKKSLRVIYFLSRFTHTSHLLKKSRILELPDKINLENCLLCHVVCPRKTQSTIWKKFMEFTHGNIYNN